MVNSMQVELCGRGLTLEVERHAAITAPQGPPVLMCMGLGMQLSSWPQPLLQALTHSGRDVICFDNRDIGLSGTGTLAQQHSTARAFWRYQIGLPFTPPYTLYDMADDTLALADALNLSQFDLIGVSMGGMIGQILAFRAPQRMRRLVSIMSSAGPRTTARPSLRIALKAMRRPSRHAPLSAVIRHFTELFELIGVLHDPTEIALMRASVERSMRRSYRPEGTGRQLLAILAAPNRSQELRGIQIPTLLLHGKRDPLVAFEAALYLKQLIPHATLHLLEEMGHYLPHAALPELFTYIDAHLSA